MNQEDMVKLAYRNINQLKAYIYVLSHDWNVVDDIMQETLISLMKSAGNYNSNKEFLPWALTFARRRTFDYFKKKRKTDLLFSEEILTSLEAEYLYQERQEPQDIMIKTLHKCLKKLSHENQAILQMKYFDKMRVEEVSKKLGRSFLSVQSLLDRLRKKLKDCMKSHLREI
ncbi:MAG: sigma-70 family RNA polymerase sigma factor [Lentisphaerales bacterium]|nr:sigma-70 family RNA polymerase sigma factor [Lentisphaerales bacterium]